MVSRDPVKRGATGYFAVLQWAYMQTDGTPTERYVLNMLAAASSDVGLTFPSVATLIRRTGLSERAIRAAITHWRDNGAITVTPRYIPGTRKICANEYQLNPDRFPEEMVEEGVQATPAPPAPLQDVHPTPAPRAPLIGVTKDLPSSSLRSRARRSRRTSEPEEAERGSWLLEDGQETEPAPARGNRPLTNVQFAEHLGRRFERQAGALRVPGGTDLGGLKKHMRRWLEAGVDREVLSEALDDFFDGAYYNDGGAAPWLQFVNQVARIAAKTEAATTVAQVADSEYKFGGPIPESLRKELGLDALPAD